MLKEIRYKGVLVGDTPIVGERNCDGVIPAHGSSALRVSRDRWMLLFSTLDTHGWDACRSIIYQLRSGSPDGGLVKEGVVAAAASGWDPFSQGISLRKSHGMPMAFGVPKSAQQGGEPFLNENVFVVKWYRWGMLERDGCLINAENQARDLWPEGVETRQRLLRVEWMQFRLNEAEDDIEILMPPRQLRQNGFETGGDVFCALGAGHHMNHAMTPPIPADVDCSVWCECDTFASIPEYPTLTHGEFAPVEYTWNAGAGLYEWTRTGALTRIPGRAMGETSISRFDGTWIVAARSFVPDASTVWYRTEDLFAGLGEPTLRPGTYGPRHSFRCADGALRIFLNHKDVSPYGDNRNPLYVIEVDPATFAYSEPRLVADARALGLPLEPPFMDMSKLCPAQGDRQLLLFRTIARRMTTGPRPEVPDPTADELAAAGIHYAELVYAEPPEPVWTFAE